MLEADGLAQRTVYITEDLFCQCPGQHDGLGCSKGFPAVTGQEGELEDAQQGIVRKKDIPRLDLLVLVNDGPTPFGIDTGGSSYFRIIFFQGRGKGGRGGGQRLPGEAGFRPGQPARRDTTPAVAHGSTPKA